METVDFAAESAAQDAANAPMTRLRSECIQPTMPSTGLPKMRQLACMGYCTILAERQPTQNAPGIKRNMVQHP